MVVLTVDTSNLDSLVGFLIALGAALWAMWENRQKAAAQISVSALTPGTPEASSPAVVQQLPPAAWQMSPETLKWLTFDATPANAATITSQVTAAEAAGKSEYTVTFIGGSYDIQYGLLKGSVGNPSGK